MICGTISGGTDYGRLETKSPSLNGRKSTPTPKILGTAETYFCLPHQPKLSDFFALWLHWVSVVRDLNDDNVFPDTRQVDILD